MGKRPDRCQSLKLLVEKLVKVEHLRMYIKEADHKEKPGPTVDRIAAGAATPPKPTPVINYMLGSPSDDQYQLKNKQMKILRCAIVKSRVKAIHTEGSREETRPIDVPISFPLVNPNRIIMPYYDALVLILFISDFDVHRVLVDSDKATYLLQLPAFNQLWISLEVLNLVGQILSGFNGVTIVTLGDVTLPIRASLVTQQVLFSIVGDLGLYNAIMGWAWLHLMKVIPSTYHQMVRYLTNEGQVNLLGS